jgi:AraC-like DNA-binding protein
MLVVIRFSKFNTPFDEIVLDASVLALPVASFNSRLRDYFDDQCRQLAPRFASDAPVASQVRRELIAAMDGGDPSMPSVARRLGMSGRSLHRRLAQERSGFDVLLDDVRQEFAKRYLAQGTISASEVAYLIGFQSPTAFFRAFKRWTGATPRTFQRSSS